jgi:tRNA modification GTPase
VSLIMQDSIVACATPPGRGGVGVVRVSGPRTAEIIQQVTQKQPKARYATYSAFYDTDASVIDLGLVLSFPKPHSFTGEDVAEFHCHGGPVIIDRLLKRITQLGARLARPGEFSERAFLNDKIDLAQAEAIADLIDSSSEQAARSAIRSLQGEFSTQIHCLVDALIQLRTYVEAALDFPEEEIDFLADASIQSQLSELTENIQHILSLATQGSILREGMRIVIAGSPNAGKSSLLNALSGYESAIVTDIPGTTRDVLREAIQLDGIPLHIIDTAGLRESTDQVEQEGIRRAEQEIREADRVLLLIDSSQGKQTLSQQPIPAAIQPLLEQQRLTVIYNKIDLTQTPPKLEQQAGVPTLYLSAKTQAGMQLLKDHLKQCIGFQSSGENVFMARRRHLRALQQALDYIQHGKQQLMQTQAGELLAEDLRLAQQQLSEITGEFSSDDLLGKIFASFCIGK